MFSKLHATCTYVGQPSRFGAIHFAILASDCPVVFEIKCICVMLELSGGKSRSSKAFLVLVTTRAKPYRVRERRAWFFLVCDDNGGETEGCFLTRKTVSRTWSGIFSHGVHGTDVGNETRRTQRQRATLLRSFPRLGRPRGETV